MCFVFLRRVFWASLTWWSTTFNHGEGSALGVSLLRVQVNHQSGVWGEEHIRSIINIFQSFPNPYDHSFLPYPFNLSPKYPSSFLPSPPQFSYSTPLPPKLSHSPYHVLDTLLLPHLSLHSFTFTQCCWASGAPLDVLEVLLCLLSCNNNKRSYPHIQFQSQYILQTYICWHPVNKQ